jgi:hypothetical protein
MALIDIQTTLIGPTHWARCAVSRDVEFLPPLGGNIAITSGGKPVALFEVSGVYLDLDVGRYTVLLEEVRADGDPPVEDFGGLLGDLAGQGWEVDGPHPHAGLEAGSESGLQE